VLKAFGPVLRNVYACSEHLILGVREADSDTMRLLEDDLIMEIYPDHALVTNLFNRTLPLIRYHMNDVLRLVDTDAHTPYRASAEAVGRVEQTAKFINRHGVADSISQYTIIELLIPGSRRFQMRITGDTAFTMAVVPESGATDEVLQTAVKAATSRLKAILARKEMDNVTFSVEFVDDIPVDARSRKFKLIVYERAPVSA
jgi:phenylacetate-coenzyme A ligase PaaK-like adenylate-forming protein